MWSVVMLSPTLSEQDASIESVSYTHLLDTSALTGESVPVDAEAGSEVMSGMITVSYTHLDVYKRQIKYNVIVIFVKVVIFKNS